MICTSRRRSSTSSGWCSLRFGMVLHANTCPVALLVHLRALPNWPSPSTSPRTYLSLMSPDFFPAARSGAGTLPRRCGRGTRPQGPWGPPLSPTRPLHSPSTKVGFLRSMVSGFPVATMIGPVATSFRLMQLPISSRSHCGGPGMWVVRGCARAGVEARQQQRGRGRQRAANDGCRDDRRGAKSPAIVGRARCGPTTRVRWQGRTTPEATEPLRPRPQQDIDHTQPGVAFQTNATGQGPVTRQDGANASASPARPLARGIRVARLPPAEIHLR